MDIFIVTFLAFLFLSYSVKDRDYLTRKLISSYPSWYDCSKVFFYYSSDILGEDNAEFEPETLTV